MAENIKKKNSTESFMQRDHEHHISPWKFVEIIFQVKRGYIKTKKRKMKPHKIKAMEAGSHMTFSEVVFMIFIIIK